MYMRKKGERHTQAVISLQFLFWLILALIVLVIAVVIIVNLAMKGQGALSFIKDFFVGG